MTTCAGRTLVTCFAIAGNSTWCACTGIPISVTLALPQTSTAGQQHACHASHFQTEKLRQTVCLRASTNFVTILTVSPESIAIQRYLSSCAIPVRFIESDWELAYEQLLQLSISRAQQRSGCVALAAQLMTGKRCDDACSRQQSCSESGSEYSCLELKNRLHARTHARTRCVLTGWPRC